MDVPAAGGGAAEYRPSEDSPRGASDRRDPSSHPPTYYFPSEDIAPDVLRRTTGSSFCEWKGLAIYYDAVSGDRILQAAAWSYPDPSPTFAIIRDHVAFYAASMDGCFVDGERVEPQPGGFYGGWITSKVAGPFKGVPGSRDW